MKKLILMASAALAFGGAAMAQDTAQPTGTASPDAATQAATPDASAPPAAPDATTAPAPTDPAAGTATGPSGPVSTTPTQGATDLPTCSKTVTDNCKQGSGKGGTHHKARHHKK